VATEPFEHVQIAANGIAVHTVSVGHGRWGRRRTGAGPVPYADLFAASPMRLVSSEGIDNMGEWLDGRRRISAALLANIH
jgi:hypothetical protein